MQRGEISLQTLHFLLCTYRDLNFFFTLHSMHQQFFFSSFRSQVHTRTVIIPFPLYNIVISTHIYSPLKHLVISSQTQLFLLIYFVAFLFTLHAVASHCVHSTTSSRASIPAQAFEFIPICISHTKLIFVYISFISLQSINMKFTSHIHVHKQI